jgi:L,D-peptidoglycan transpeptidase YkuD (ErfK/YbiS/YcfS/YnhG family)
VSALLVALLLAADPVVPTGPGKVTLSEAEVFPGGDGASAATLDALLPKAIQAWQAEHKKQRFAKKIVVHKARRRLDVYADDAILKSYIVNLGLSPEGDKEREGDMKTPEGELFLCSKNKQSQFTRFLELAYPSPAHAAKALEGKRVAAKVAQDTKAAYQRRDRCPPQTSPLGGLVGIHGKGDWSREGQDFVGYDWTFGCIGLRDADIHELFDSYAEVGIPVVVLAQ